MKTKAAILVEQKKDPVVDEIEIPKLEHGKVLVEIKSPAYADLNWEKLTGSRVPTTISLTCLDTRQAESYAKWVLWSPG